MIPPGSKHRKLLNTLYNKAFYIAHYTSIKQALQNGMILTCVHRVLGFDQSPWLKPYIDLNTKLKTDAKNKFEQEFFKLLINSFFGRSMESVRKRRKIELVSTPERAQKLIAKPTFLEARIFRPNLTAFHMQKSQIYMNKPIYLGSAILDLSKVHMYNFFYNVLVPWFKIDCLNIISYDTDGFLIDIKCEDFYKEMAKKLEFFDTSGFPKDHICYSEKNKKVPGIMKDELNSKLISHVIALRPKSYCFKVENKDVVKKLKGVKKYCIQTKITYEDFEKVLAEQTVLRRDFNLIQSKLCNVYTMRQQKICMSSIDDKRCFASDHTSLPWGHYSLKQ